MCRPSFVLEVFLRTEQYSYTMNKRFVIQTVELLSFKVDWQAIMLSLKVTTFEFSFFFSSRRRHTRSLRDWSSDVWSSDLLPHFGGRRCSKGDCSPPAWGR